MLLPWLVARPSSAQTAPTGKESSAAMSTAPQDSPPRKIVVGSLMYAMYRDYPGLEKRLQTLSAFIDDMARQSQQKYGVGLDLVALPEFAVNGGRQGSAAEVAEPMQGPVLDIMGAAARKHKTYVIVPLYLAEGVSSGKKVCNACVLLDRQGRVAGVYRKVYVVADDANVLEGGALPGKDFPVFQCDFGKVGIQVCFDMCYDAGWETLARKGAEIVVWSTQSPQIIGAQCRSHEHHYYLLTSTWRNNATLVDPTGAVIAQTTTPSSVLVEQIDLSYVLLDWQVKLENGKALADKYGKAVGFRYSEAEDGGIFWSNDPKIPVMRMVRELGLELSADCLSRNRRLQDEARGGPPSLK